VANVESTSTPAIMAPSPSHLATMNPHKRQRRLDCNIANRGGSRGLDPKPVGLPRWSWPKPSRLREPLFLLDRPSITALEVVVRRRPRPPSTRPRSRGLANSVGQSRRPRRSGSTSPVAGGGCQGGPPGLPGTPGLDQSLDHLLIARCRRRRQIVLALLLQDTVGQSKPGVQGRESLRDERDRTMARSWTKGLSAGSCAFVNGGTWRQARRTDRSVAVSGRLLTRTPGRTGRRPHT
jgi:hypothetical protein